MQLLTPDFGFLIWIFIGIGLINLLLFLGALISILKNDFTDSTVKLMWVLIVLFVPFFGPIVYFAIGGKHKVQNIN